MTGLTPKESLCLFHLTANVLCFHWSILPVVELKAGPPVWCPEQRLQSTGEIDKHVAH